VSREDAERLFEAGDYAAAAERYRALAQDAPTLTRLGQCALYGYHADAAPYFERALALRPDYAPALAGLGDCEAFAGRHGAALERYDEAIAVDPGDPWIRNNRAQSLLAAGRLREAWAESEARFELQARTRAFWQAPPVPRWRGESLAGALIVLWEQGLGDIIQHLRFLPLARARVGGLAFLCPVPLVRLVAASFPDIEIVATGAPLSWDRYAACAPLLSLPHVLDLDWATLPRAPYLRAEPGRRADSGLRRVGIVWRSSRFDSRRDCQLEELLEIEQAGAQAVSLQHEPTAEEEARLGARLATAPVRDFYDTAKMIEGLDAVVSVDTSVAHLAGALGAPTWVLLGEPAATRWMLEREDSPWYPSMTLLRKRDTDAWAPCVARAARALRERFGRR
jgi:tetratricopeptide (TPR) repeat protein